VAKTDYRALKRSCVDHAVLIQPVIDDFLLYYVDDREDLSARFVHGLRRYREASESMPPALVMQLASQYIGYHLFHENGLIGKYRGHRAVRELPPREQAFVDHLLEHPWNYSFATFDAHPHPEFFRMSDICTGESYLLYSPSIESYVEDEGVTPPLLFLLREFDGNCWHSYGPMMDFHGLHPSDLVSFGKWLCRDVRSLSDVPACVSGDPIPWFMLWSFGEILDAFHNNDMFAFNRAEYFQLSITPDALAKSFVIERSDDLYHLGLKRWRGHPHVAECFYDPLSKYLLIQATTDRGFARLTAALRDEGVNVDPHPHTRLSTAGREAFLHVLGWESVYPPIVMRFKTELELDRDALQEQDPVRGQEAERDRDTERERRRTTEKTRRRGGLGALLERYAEYRDAGTPCDIDDLARQYGVDPALARDMINRIWKTPLK
jgi:hypothetical protein